MTPFLDRLTREVTRPKGSAPPSSPRWTRCGRSIRRRRRTGRPVILEVTGSNPARRGTRTESSRRGGRRRARAGGHAGRTDSAAATREARRLLRKSTSQLRRRDARPSTSAATDARRDRRRGRKRERSRRISHPTWRRSRRARREADEATARREDASFAAAPDAAKTTTTTTTTTTTVRTMPSSSRDRLVRGGSPSTNSCRLRGSRRRPRARRPESCDSDDDPTSDPPLSRCLSLRNCRYTRKRGDRALYEEWDFCPSRLRPRPPAEVLRASFASTPGLSAAAATAESRGLDVVETADALTAVSGEVVTALDRLLATLKSRDEKATRAASARTAEEEEKLRRATVRVAVAHDAAAGDVDATLAFDAAVRRGCEEARGTSWTRSGGGTARTFAPRRFASSVIFAVGAVGNAREREKRGSWRVWRTCDTRRCSFGSGRGESTPRRFAACDSSLRRRIRDASGRSDERF